MAYLQILPYFPAFLAKKNINKLFLGYLMSVLSVFFIISAFITGKYLLKYIRRIEGVLYGAFLIVS